MNAWRSFQTWMFGYGSATTMGLFRILVGFLCLTNLLMVGLHFEAFFTERGYYPVAWAERWASGTFRLNLLAGTTDSNITLAFYILVCVAALFTTIGLWTRISSILLFVGVVTLHHRSPDILHSGDTLMRQWLFLVALAPSGAACSVDRLMALAKGKVSSEPAMVSLWPQRLMQYQLAIVYFTTVWHKWGGSQWRDGTATWYPAQLHEFDRFPVPGFVETVPMVMITTYGTLLVELALATLVFAKPLRKWVLLAGLALHGYIEYSMNIPLFAFIICSGYVTFYHGEEVSAWFERLGKRFKAWRVSLSVPQGVDLESGKAAAILSADFLSLIEVQRGRDGLAGMEGKVLRATPAFWPLALVGRWKKFFRSAFSYPEVGTAVVDDGVREGIKR